MLSAHILLLHWVLDVLSPDYGVRAFSCVLVCGQRHKTPNMYTGLFFMDAPPGLTLMTYSSLAVITV